MRAFQEEFDRSDPEQTEVSLDEHLSNLVSEGILDGSVSLHLEDVLAYILKVSEQDELFKDAEDFRVLISSYGDDPTEDDMDDAYDLLTRIIVGLDKIGGHGEVHGQTRISFE